MSAEVKARRRNPHNHNVGFATEIYTRLLSPRESLVWCFDQLAKQSQRPFWFYDRFRHKPDV
jgi:hypothetical protein